MYEGGKVMRCTNCNGELRIGTEQVGVDNNRLPLFHRFGYCDKCRMKYDIDVIMQRQAQNAIINTKNTKRACPKCKGFNYHAFVEEQVVIPKKVRSKTTLNLNPLKPFTVFNHKEKIVRQQVTKQVGKFVCDDCGKIFQ